MEMVLKLQMKTYERTLLSWEFCKGLLVLFSVLILAVNAYLYGGKYYKLVNGEEIGSCSVMGKITSDRVRKIYEIAEMLRRIPNEDRLVEAEEMLMEFSEVNQVDTGYKGGSTTETLPPAETAAAESESAESSEEVLPFIMSINVYGNGGIPEFFTMSCEPEAFTVETLEVPRRMGKLFDGWYLDAECTVPYVGQTEKLEVLNLYAGWKEFEGFLADDSGYITGCTKQKELLVDGLLWLPAYDTCVGVLENAFAGLGDAVYEICIPPNITDISVDAFAGFSNLMYIQVLEGNPRYYSENGILYYSDGTEAVYPAGRRR